MARYKVLEPTFDNATGVMLDVGDELEFEGTPGTNLAPLDKAAEKAVEAAPPPSPDPGGSLS